MFRNVNSFMVSSLVLEKDVFVLVFYASGYRNFSVCSTPQSVAAVLFSMLTSLSVYLWFLAMSLIYTHSVQYFTQRLTPNSNEDRYNTTSQQRHPVAEHIAPINFDYFLPYLLILI